MHIERLIKMANDSGDFFKAEADREDAVRGAAAHIQRFWESRMRLQLIDYVQKDGSLLDDIVRDAVRSISESPANDAQAGAGVTDLR